MKQPTFSSSFAFWGLCTLAITMGSVSYAQTSPKPLRDTLKTLPFKIAHESYVNDNWDILVMNADGSNPVNLTHTTNANELYPQASPDGSKFAFLNDSGGDKKNIRSVWVMDIDGQNRKKIADYAREPFWSPDSKMVGFLEQEYPKFNVIDFFTKGMNFCDLATGKITPHVNATNLYHLYNPNFSPNGKWLTAVVHAGRTVNHGILLIEAKGNKIIHTRLPGCRPRFSPDGKQIAWNSGDQDISIAPIDMTTEIPVVGQRRLIIKDNTNHIYHAAWSPDSKYLCFSRGPNGEGDVTKVNTFTGQAPIIGIHANGWNICAVSTERDGTIELNTATDADVAILTTNGLSNKQPIWFLPKSRTNAQ